MPTPLDLDRLLSLCHFDAIVVDANVVNDMSISRLDASTTALFLALTDVGVVLAARPYRAAFSKKPDAVCYNVEHVGFLLDYEGQYFDGLGHRSLEDIHVHLRQSYKGFDYGFCRLMTPQDFTEVSEWSDDKHVPLFSPHPSFETEDDLGGLFLPPARAWVQSCLLDEQVLQSSGSRSMRL